MAKLASSIVAALLFVVICYHSIPVAQATIQVCKNCTNRVNVSQAQKNITRMLGVHVYYGI